MFGQCAEPLALATGIFAGNHSYVAGQRLPVREPLRITQEHIGCQIGDWPYARMGQEQSCSGTLPRLLGDLLQALDDLVDAIGLKAA